MLKYVALMKVDRPALWSKWHTGSTAQYYKSEIETDKEKVEKWLKEELEKYPNARVNENISDREYLIRNTIIAFDENESENVEAFIKNLF